MHSNSQQPLWEPGTLLKMWRHPEWGIGIMSDRTQYRADGWHYVVDFRHGTETNLRFDELHPPSLREFCWWYNPQRREQQIGRWTAWIIIVQLIASVALIIAGIYTLNLDLQWHIGGGITCILIGVARLVSIPIGLVKNYAICTATNPQANTRT